jgi:hypothetical protein
VAITLVALLGIMALAADGGFLLVARRKTQAAADAAALAAAADLYKNYMKNGGADSSSGTALASAQDVAVANGISQSNVIVRMHGSNYLGGANAGKAVPLGYAEVTVTYFQKRYFSTIFGSGDIPVSARAVGRGRLAQTTAPAVLILDPTGSGAITDKGGGNDGGMTVTGSVVVNSSSSSAISTTGHATLTASKFVITGNYGGSNLVTTPTPNQITTGASPTADPLAYLPAPAMPAKADWYTDGKGNVSVPPGTYGVNSSDPKNNLDNIPNNSNVYFIQSSAGLGSVIYVVSGGFNSNNATYQLDPATSGGIMIYNTSTTGIDLGGNKSSSFSLTAPTSGLYKGIAYFQARSSTGSIDLGGNGSITITGTIYAPNASASYSGNGSGTIGSQLIVKDLSMNGNGNATVNYSSSTTGQLRLFGLVE